MELRTTEQEANELSHLYSFLCQDDTLKGVLPPLTIISTTGIDNEETLPDESPNTDEAQQATKVLATLESLRERLENIAPKMERFRQRLSETDPVTQKPRYGEKTAVRVLALLKLYDELAAGLDAAFGEEPEITTETQQEQSQATAAVDLIRQQADLERSQAEREDLAKQQELERQQAAIEAEKKQQKEEQLRLEEAQKLQIEQQQAQEARIAREARDTERRALEEANRADRQWAASVTKGPEGVREQLRILLESTAADAAAQKAAIYALHTLFSQIVAHPEETNFRRIRRDHPKFHDDIGRHTGGREVLIASGFSLGAIDEVPSFISKEPNIEKDMDGWSAWFDLLKATLVITEEQLMK
jgi:hypothetical protein